MEGGRKENVTARDLGNKPQNPTLAHLSRKRSGALTVSEKRKTMLRNKKEPNALAVVSQDKLTQATEVWYKDPTLQCCLQSMLKELSPRPCLG